MVSFWNKLWVDSTTRIPNHHRWVSLNDFLETSEPDHHAYIYSFTKNKTHARNWVLAYLDGKGFDKQVFLVSASGFFTDSYALFATNVILPSLAYIYWPSTSSNHPELVINCVTLLGSACGQALFGFLADKWGRRKLYGVELVIVIFGTLGMTQVSTGANQSMSILWWIIFWRFMLGLGIGAEYPLSACITAEFASTEYRATMMASVFLMQPFAQFCAATVGWIVLTSLVKSRGLDNLPIHGADLTDRQKFDIISTIDSVWRCVVGVGAIPALFAIIYRLSIPESPRYSMDVLDNGMGAFYDIRGHYNLETTEEYALQTIGVETLAEGPPSMEDLPSPIETAPPVEHSAGVGPTGEHPAAADPIIATDSTPANPAPAHQIQHIQHWGPLEPPDYFTYDKLHEYFIAEGNWVWLAATSTCWFLLDFAFYGLGIDNPRRIAAIWEPSYPTPADFQDNIQNWPSNFLVGENTTTVSNATIPDWENPFDVESNIYQELYGNALRYVVTITVGSLVGSLVMIALINKLPRKGWLIISFLILALLFLIMGATLQAVEFHPSHWFTVVFYITCQFFFNWGKNFQGRCALTYFMLNNGA
jgi:PHS family inorganic phosphate transporter-like MFS transporter